MIKRVTTIILILFLISMIFVGNTSYAICNTIRAKKEISAVKLTLSDGQVLYNFKVKQSDTNTGVLNPTQVQKAKNLDLIFLIDTQTSNLNAEKEIVKTAISSFKTFYIRSGLSKVNVGIIGFNDNHLSDTEFSSKTFNLKNMGSQESEINDELNNLQNKDMDIGQATTLADTKLEVLRTR